MVTATKITNCEAVINVNGIELWTQGFGNIKNPCIILIMGAGGQGIQWPVQFCEMLAQEGYFVIRFDHRDTGLSSAINFETSPYTLLDMANDVVGILDHYHLPNAHIVGASMGGAISMLLAAHYPERTRSLTLLVTSIDFRPAFDLYQGFPNTHDLPAPSFKVIEVARKFAITPPTTLEEKIQFYIDTAKLNSGSMPLDEELCKELAILSFKRAKNAENNDNHYKAIIASHDIHAAAISKITAPTHIVHGDEDLIFPLEHGKATHAAITGSTLCIIPGLGHNLLSQELLQPILENIMTTIKTAEK
jgi:pimeloyl-ACP methyl ester carboxylesterase